MSLKRVLGMMLASRMGGRGRRRGSLGTAAMLGGMGMGRRRGMGGKLGMAALGYMAYQAYQDHQRQSAGRSPGGAAGTHGSTGGAGGTGGIGGAGGIGGMIRDVADRLTGSGVSGGGMAGTAAGGAAAGGAASGASENELREQKRAAESFSDEKALLLIRAMITAAYSDGALSEAERGRIMGEIEQSDADLDDRRTMEREIANPRPLDELLTQVNDHETAEEFYLASRAAIDGETEQNRSYLATLRQRLNITDEEAAEVEELAS